MTQHITGFADGEALPLDLVMIPKEHVANVLPMVLDKLEDVADRSRGRVTVPGLIREFTSGSWQMWFVWDGVTAHAVVGTELYRDIGGLKICAVRFASGDNSSGWVHLISVLEQFARANECDKIDMTARKGWAKKFPDYKLTHVILEKDL
jgi:hypothetical protein